MKNQFRQYSDLSEGDYKRAWEGALFVFDTNVLLNLYRYREGARNDFLRILELLKKRIWIPHHVALEFYRNRLSVIGEQIARFADVANVINDAQKALVKALNELQLDKRHSLIDPAVLLESISKEIEAFHKKLSDLQSKQQQLTGPDPLKSQLEAMFEGRVGNPIEGKELLDQLQKDADARFKVGIPPGYMDDGKDKKEPDEFMHAGLIYKRKYGDFIVWKQILQYAKENGVKQLIFITDDTKEDWWLKLDVRGNKTIGPRSELIDEAHFEGNVDAFLMYNSVRFLDFAKNFLKEEVSKETLDEVRDISRMVEQPAIPFPISIRSEKGVENWIRDTWKASQIIYPADGQIDFIVEQGTKQLGFAVRVITPKRWESISATYEHISRMASYADMNELDEISIIYVLDESELSSRGQKLFKIFSEAYTTREVRLVIGSLALNGVFLPMYEKIFHSVNTNT